MRRHFTYNKNLIFVYFQLERSLLLQGMHPESFGRRDRRREDRAEVFDPLRPAVRALHTSESSRRQHVLKVAGKDSVGRNRKG